jgi:hypothetical protein
MCDETRWAHSPDPANARGSAQLGPIRTAAPSNAPIESSGNRDETTMMCEPKPPPPRFTQETAAQKVQAAEDAWNTRERERFAQTYTVDSVRRNRDLFRHRAQRDQPTAARNPDRSPQLTDPQ